ncbi:MAG: hypothetical protein A3A24_02895 [Candidatus Buchananbacteria bacterium RIFCSPLOWO2_01_FULL_46_12]|uniref:Peptidase M50 domain-containing protein n=2 Tax=Candidatus Buchananiibacteriota TaxID=1817903 RepID=A0A1G1YRC4_9BACT|nr:MAG: hypothetical protein A2744_01265 [Candidatus Buchananbacteria bacterium RIFCSPHIGHO2_01_FULL_44_11]OGY54854.1 MAG: hypothetical protein A3A24_02895 [Candidatus Buchananbacteria bacterium RIFCSPLOWO2_01_FULL_46_12]
MSAIILLIYLSVFLYSVILHEIAHGFVAYRFGDDTAKASGRLSFNPLIHIDLFGSILVPLLLLISQSSFLFGWAKPVPVNPYRLHGGQYAYRLVTAAGVLTNLALALASGLILKIATQVFDLPPTNLGVIFFASAFFINIILAVFNCLPLPNFDGFNFLTTFSLPGNILRKTPLANPLFMVQYGLLVSLLLLFLLFPLINQVIVLVLSWMAYLFGITPTVVGVLDLL